MMKTLILSPLSTYIKRFQHEPSRITKVNDLTNIRNQLLNS